MGQEVVAQAGEVVRGPVLRFDGSSAVAAAIPGPKRALLLAPSGYRKKTVGRRLAT
jgi:hypothetical protein